MGVETTLMDREVEYIHGQSIMICPNKESVSE
jgi:hypothetical protein